MNDNINNEPSSIIWRFGRFVIEYVEGNPFQGSVIRTVRCWKVLGHVNRTRVEYRGMMDRFIIIMSMGHFLMSVRISRRESTRDRGCLNPPGMKYHKTRGSGEQD